MEFSQSHIDLSLNGVIYTAQKMKFSVKDFFSKCDLVTFTEEILNGKLHFLCSFTNPAA